MELADVINKKLANLDNVPDNLITTYEARQKAVLVEVLELLKGLELDSDGNVKQTKANYDKIATISKRAESILLKDPEIIKGVKSFSESMNEQKALNKKMFELSIKGYSDKQIFETAYINSKTIVLDNLKSSGINEAFTKPLKELLNVNVSTKASYSNLVVGLTDFVLGSENTDPSLIKHVKQVAWDGFSNTDAAYVNTIASSLNVDWFKYSGASLKESRGFCKERKKGIFHRKEVEDWGRKIATQGMRWPIGQKWQGMAKNTDEYTIWVKRGGYRCVDAFIPIDVLDVPQSDIIRARNAGYI